MARLVLVVCKGNIHRSVIAEMCIRKNLQELGLEEKFQVTSRGLQGSGQSKMPSPNIKHYPLEWEHTEPLLRELGIEIPDTQTATPIDRNVAEEASLILTMDSQVLCGFFKDDLIKNLVSQFPEFGFKMRLFSEMAGEVCDVPDRAGKKDTSLYRQVISMIQSTAKTGVQQMCQLAELLNPHP